MIADELMEQYLEDDEPIKEKTQDEKDAEAFMKKLEDSKSIIQTEGGFAGLCEHCLGTEKAYITKRSDDYEGIQYRIDNEIQQIVKCFCDGIEEEQYPF